MMHAWMRRESGRALLRGLDGGWAGLQSNYQRSKQAGTCPLPPSPEQQYRRAPVQGRAKPWLTQARRCELVPRILCFAWTAT